MFVLRACLRGGGSFGAGLLSRSARRISQPSGRGVLPSIVRPALPSAVIDVRSFSSSGGDGNDDKDKEGNASSDDRSYFLDDEDSIPAPPSYVRDAVTGKWTDRTHAELSSKDRKLLNLDEDSKGDELMERLEERWKEASAEAAEGGGEDDGLGSLTGEHGRVARRIQEEQLAMGTVGRSPRKNDVDDDSIDTEKPLSPREYQALKAYAQKEHGVHPKDFARLTEDDPDLIPINTVSSGADGAADAKHFFDADLDLAYLNPRMNKRAFRGEGAEDEDPFADLLPSDLNPARKVNRRHAKRIPKRLLHHNNLSLLRRYTTPGGKIMNRVQSRLGAKDQRKIAKLVKRARMLGLIPHLGQWKFEDHGHLHEPGLEEAADQSATGEETEGKRDWELELEKRGLWPLQDETELIKRYYDMERMMDHIAGPRAAEGERRNKKRDELERLIGGFGALVAEEKRREKSAEEGGDGERHGK